MEEHISVCIATLHRNLSLERLLRKMANQETHGLFDFSLIVVDNDAAGPARETVIRLKEELGLNIIYDLEPIQTIPAARNHALRLATGNYIGIIDDDEFPPHHWLRTLYCAIQTFDVDGALGPVHPFFETQPPAWLLKSRFCERPVYRTGTLLHWNQTRTGNVLLKKAVFEKNNLYFDMKYKTGGSDQAFFKQAMQAGYKFVACEEAPVYEVVSQERWMKSYYLRRALVNGFNSYRYVMNEPKNFTRLSSSLRSAAALLVYAIATPFSVIMGSHQVMNCLEKGIYHLSRICAMLGIELVKKRNF
jgi:glycosyltransferase involved in cell wall biosynthesis